MFNLYVVNRAGPFLRHAVDPLTQCRYYDLYASAPFEDFWFWISTRLVLNPFPYRHQPTLGSRGHLFPTSLIIFQGPGFASQQLSPRR